MEKIAPQLHRIKELLEENPFTDERDSSDEEEPDLHTQEPVALKREKVRRVCSRSGSVRVRAAWSQLPLPCGPGLCCCCQAYTFAELEALVQASPAEIAKGLTDLDAVEHNGGGTCQHRPLPFSASSHV